MGQENGDRIKEHAPARGSIRAWAQGERPREKLLRHGAHPDVLEFPLIRGMYDMVFGYTDGDFERPSFSAGLAVLLTGIALFQYRGAFFWKMTAAGAPTSGPNSCAAQS